MSKTKLKFEFDFDDVFKGIQAGIIRELAEHGVSSNVHYKPLPMMTAYKAYGWEIKDFPNAFDYYHNLITLPLHTKLSNEDVDYICTILKKVISEIS